MPSIYSNSKAQNVHNEHVQIILKNAGAKDVVDIHSCCSIAVLVNLHHLFIHGADVARSVSLKHGSHAIHIGKVSFGRHYSFSDPFNALHYENNALFNSTFCGYCYNYQFEQLKAQYVGLKRGSHNKVIERGPL